MSQQISLKISLFFLFLFRHFAHFTAKIAITGVWVLQSGCPYRGSKGKCQHRIWDNIEEFISDFTHKAKLNFCHAYRVNHFNKQPENLYVAWLNIRGVPFGGFKLSRVREGRDMKLNSPLVKKNVQSILRNKKSKKGQYHTNCQEE